MHQSLHCKCIASALQVQPKCGNRDLPVGDQGSGNGTYSAINSVYDFECMLKTRTHPSCKDAYLNQLQQVSEHLPLAVLLLS